MFTNLELNVTWLALQTLKQKLYGATDTTVEQALQPQYTSRCRAWPKAGDGASVTWYTLTQWPPGAHMTHHNHHL